jgi:hypothetical protein
MGPHWTAATGDSLKSVALSHGRLRGGFMMLMIIALFLGSVLAHPLNP